MSRLIRFGTVSFLIQESSSVSLNLDLARRYVHEAAELRCSVLCFPEYMLTNGVTSPLPAEESLVESVKALAKEFEIALVAPLLYSEKGSTFSAAIVINFDGSLAGVYRKVQLNGAELETMNAGSVIEPMEVTTRDGKFSAGIMLCMDIYFPEIARIYALKGADILFWPTVMLGPTQEILLAQLRTRAHDNSLPIIESNIVGSSPYAPYAGSSLPGNAKILDHNGDILVQTGRREGIAVAEIDLDVPRKTSQCVLLQEPDDTRKDLESIARMDLYAKEYTAIAKRKSQTP